MATTTDDLFFNNENQSLYKDNVTITNVWQERFGTSWDVPDVNVDESLGKVVVIPKVTARIFGKKITIIPELSIDFDTEFKFFFDSQGKIGGELQARSDLVLLISAEK